MSHILDVISESSWSTLLYHGTTKNFHPNDIAPGSHLGSPGASRNRSGSEVNFYSQDRLKVHAYKYNPSGRIVDVKDRGADEPHWTRDAMKQIKNHVTPESYKIIKRDPSDTKTIGHMLRWNGISALKYKNPHEGGHSFVVYDPENLTHVHTFDKPKLR